MQLSFSTLFLHPEFRKRYSAFMHDFKHAKKHVNIVLMAESILGLQNLVNNSEAEGKISAKRKHKLLKKIDKISKNFTEWVDANKEQIILKAKSQEMKSRPLQLLKTLAIFNSPKLESGFGLSAENLAKYLAAYSSPESMLVYIHGIAAEDNVDINFRAELLARLDQTNKAPNANIADIIVNKIFAKIGTVQDMNFDKPVYFNLLKEDQKQNRDIFCRAFAKLLASDYLTPNRYAEVMERAVHGADFGAWLVEYYNPDFAKALDRLDNAAKLTIIGNMTPPLRTLNRRNFLNHLKDSTDTVISAAATRALERLEPKAQEHKP